MAIPDWIKVTPVSGSGDGQLSISAESHTGRVDRSYGNGTSSGVKVTAGNVTKYIKVTQSAKAAFVKFDKSTFTCSSSSTMITVTGTSNCKVLTFTLKGNSTVTKAGTTCQMNFFEGSTNLGTKYKSEVSSKATFEAYSSTEYTIAKYTGASSTQKSGEALAGDPGAANEYPFSINICFDTNNTGSTQEVVSLAVTGDTSSIISTCDIVRNAADVFLNLSSTVVSLVTEGTAKTIDIDSNGSWSVSGS